MHCVTPSRLPKPVLLGYRPRKPWTPPPSYEMNGVTVASASDCLCDPVLPAEPDWDNMNTAMHYDTPQEAVEAAQRFGATKFEVHATRLWPLKFQGETIERFALELARHGDRTSKPACCNACESLGFDVVSVPTAEFDSAAQRCDRLPLDCSPLSCNAMGAEYPVNRWCLLATIDAAVSTAMAFARDEPEPGPFVIVEVLRYPIATND